jgi:hypothetical protein
MENTKANITSRDILDLDHRSDIEERGFIVVGS